MGRPKEEKERGEGKGKCGLGFPLPSLPPLSFPLGKTWQGGARQGRAPRGPTTSPRARPVLSPPPPTYIYVGVGHLAHTRLVVSRLRRRPPPFTPPVIFS